MEDRLEKISKACEPCRRRKIRCNGDKPCNRCRNKPSECEYRLRARIRKSTQRRAASDATLGPPPEPRATSPHFIDTVAATQTDVHADAARSKLYHSVAATHGNESDSTDSSRLFYGPSSQFAFLQQLHREILSCTSRGHHSDREVQEGGAGLDLFMQRSIFFGTAPRSGLGNLQPSSSLASVVPLEQATEFMNNFKVAFRHNLPMFNDAELDDMLQHVYTQVPDAASISSQTRAVTLAVLAIGALTTIHTDLAEFLFIKSKQEAVVYDDTVSIPMIQLSILLAEYQTNMGRPNSAYLNLGVACRKAFAMGLHKENDATLGASEGVQKRRITLWCMYFSESWHALTLGRETSIRMADISTPFPDAQPVLVSLCKLAHITVDGAKILYGRRYASLGQLYVAAEKVHAQLREFAERSGVGSVGIINKNKIPDGVASLQLHNAYYHSILLTFRPFLIAESALRLSPSAGSEGIWLRQACRYAIDAAQDSIVYTDASVRKTAACKGLRYTAFYIDSACVVLLYDILRHPSKHTYHVEYIQMGLNALGGLIEDEPPTVSKRSMEQGLRIVEAAIFRKAQDTHSRLGSAPGEQISTSPKQIGRGDQLIHQNIQIPSLNAQSTYPVQQWIHFSDLPGGAGSDPEQIPNGLDGLLPFDGSATLYPQYDVLTTDLFNFFPLDLMSPHTASTLDSNT